MPNKLSVSTTQSDPSGEKDLCFHLTWPTRGTGSKAGGSVVKVDVENRSDSQPAIFKFKTTNPKRYLVVPNQGFILPGETETVELVLLGHSVQKLLNESIQNGGNPPDSDKDKFQLLGYWRDEKTHTDFAGLTPKELLTQLQEVQQDDPNRSRKLLSCVFNLIDDATFTKAAKGDGIDYKELRDNLSNVFSSIGKKDELLMKKKLTCRFTSNCWGKTAEEVRAAESAAAGLGDGAVADAKGSVSAQTGGATSGAAAMAQATAAAAAAKAVAERDAAAIKLAEAESRASAAAVQATAAATMDAVTEQKNKAFQKEQQHQQERQKQQHQQQQQQPQTQKQKQQKDSVANDIDLYRRYSECTATLAEYIARNHRLTKKLDAATREIEKYRAQDQARRAKEAATRGFGVSLPEPAATGKDEAGKDRVLDRGLKEQQQREREAAELAAQGQMGYSLAMVLFVAFLAFAIGRVLG